MGYLMYFKTLLSAYPMIRPLFRFLDRNLSNFFVDFLEHLRHQKDILKLTDLSNIFSYGCFYEIFGPIIRYLL